MAMNETLRLRCGDDKFGPALQDCDFEADRGDFDFTLLFEQSILFLLPSALLLVAVSIRGTQLFRLPVKVRRDFLYGAKLITICLYGILQLALLVLWTQSKVVRTKVSIAAATLNLLDAFGLYALSHAEHTRSISPSSVISVYLLFSTLFDAVQCRTLWLLPTPQSIAGLFTASIAIKLLMLFLEAREKGRLVFPRWITSSPEEISGVFSRGLFWWLNSLMGRGYRGVLSMDSLYATDSALDSAKLLEGMIKEWDKSTAEKQRALFWAVIRTLKWTISSAVLPRLAKTVFTFAQPFLINSVIKYIGKNEADTDKNIGYGLIGAAGLVYVGIAISNGMYEHKSYRFVTSVRGAMVSLIYTKTLNLSATATANVDATAALSLMSTDVQGICASVANIHDLWSCVVETGLAIYLLYLQVSYACVVPVAVALFCTVATSFLANYTPRASIAWNAAIQARVSRTSFILSHMREVKLLGLSSKWETELQEMRRAELETSKASRRLNVWNNVISNMTFYITPIATFGVFIVVTKTSGKTFDVATALTSLSIIVLLSNPMAALFTSWPRFAGALGMFDRIQKFLNSESRPLLVVKSRTLDTAQQSHDSEDGVELQDFSAIRRSGKSGGEIVLSLKNAAYSLKLEGLPLVRDVSLDVHRSTLTMIIGKVGSGKSTLLKGILEELPLTAGASTRLFSNAAYCDQQSWLVNDTIQNNIIGESGFNSKWYETTVTACALDRDFKQLALGDQSVVGSKGITLSGGQKQRVALARAVYARSEILIVDDVLSGLDWATEDIVWSKVFSKNGLLQRNGATVIIATHAVRHIREADQVVVMENNTVIERGTFGQLNQRAGYVQNLLVIEQVEKSSEESLTMASDTAKAPVKPAGPMLEQAQDLSRSMGDTSLYRYYMKSIGFPYCAILVSCKIFWAFFEFFPQVWLRWWAEAEVTSPGIETGYYFGIYAMFGVGAMAFVGMTIWLMFIVIAPKSSNNLHWKLLQAVMGARMSFFFAVDTGVTLNRFSQDMSLVDQALPAALFGTLWGFVSCIASLILMVAGNVYIAIGLPFIVGLMYILQLFYLRTSRQIRFLDLEAKSPLYSHFSETVSGLMTIRAFGWQNSFEATNIRLLDNSQKPFYLMFCIQRWLNLVLDLFVAAVAILLITLAVSTKSTTTAGGIGIALLNVLSFSSQLTSLITAWTGLETSLGAISRIKGFERDTPQEQDIEPISGSSVSAAWPENGAIDFNNVTVSYSDEAGPVIQNLNLYIKPGEKFALCGRSGSGKSSLVLALFRLLDLDNGRATIDSTSTEEIHRGLLRTRLNAIPQDPILFPGTVRFNAYPYVTASSTIQEPSDQDILEALSSVGLTLPIEENGGLSALISAIPLSHGQKQLFCLARAILRKSTQACKILVLDEATANVDGETEGVMMDVIDRHFADCTVLAVMHRLDAVVERFDKVAILEKGVLVEVGEPKELLKHTGGAFRSLWDSRN